MGSVHLKLLLWVLLLVRVDAQNEARDEVATLSTWKGLINEDSNLNNPSNFVPGGYFNTWNTSDPNPCAWVGVTCTANLTVEELDLSGWELSYWSLDLLARLADLRRLDLSYSKLVPNILPKVESNSFPADVALLTALTYLDLSNSGLQGTIPASISNWTTLQYLSLEQNQLSGEIPSLHGLVNLEVLLLGGNNLTGQFPKDMSGIDSLVRMDLSDNQLEGAFPSLSSFPNLVELKLDNNNFTEFGELQSSSTIGLQRLFVSGNQLGGIIPPHITNLLNLQVLNMSGNRLLGISSGFSKLWNNSLISVDLSQNNLSGNIPSDFLAPPSHAIYINLSVDPFP